MTDAPPAHVTGEAAARYGHLATDQQLDDVSEALAANGFDVALVDSGAEARARVLALLPERAEVFNHTSRTLETIGLAHDIEQSGRYEALRPRLYRMDREMQGREMRQMASSPDFAVGSAHAVTAGGSLLVASASGSQLGPIVSGAGHVILVIGGQKLVEDIDDGMRRIDEYCFPLEDQRARSAYGVGSGVNNVLIVNRVVAPGRISLILVKEVLGF